MMRYWTFTVVALAGLASMGLADQITVNNQPYPGGTVVGIEDCAVLYRMPSGAEMTEALARVNHIQIDGEAEFNAAEDALREGNVDEAMRLYRQAQNLSNREWMLELGEIRRIQATAQGDDIEQAVDDWIELLEDQDFSANAIALLPQNTSRVRENNEAALALLTELRQRDGIAKPEDMDPNDPEAALWLAITEQMATLAEALGDTDLVAQLAGEMLGGSGGPTVGGDPARVDRILDAAELLLDYPDRQEEIVQTVTDNLPACTRPQLVRAFMLRGKAYQNMAETAETDLERDDLLAEAGLDYMHVVVFFRAYDEAADAMLQVAVVNEQLGNLPAARATYDRVIDEHEATDAATRAQEAIDRLMNADSE
jgi:tetratricopeptide (TPR) repeat protein